MTAVPDPELREALEETMARVPVEQGALRVELSSQLARLPPYVTDMPRGKAMCAEAVELARELGNPRRLLEALDATLGAFSGPDDVDALLDTAAEMLTWEPPELRTMLGLDALLARVHACLVRGDREEADRAVDAYGEGATAMRTTEGGWFHQRLLAQREYHEGRFVEAERRYDELARRGRRLGLFYARFFHFQQTLLLRRAREGLTEVMRAGGSAALEPYRRMPAALAVAVGFAVEAGLADLVRDDYERLAAAGFDVIPKNGVWLHVSTWLAVAAVGYGDRPRMLDVYERLRPHAALHALDALFLSEGSVSHHLGMLARALGEHRDAEAHFEQAIASNRAMHMRPHVVRSQVAYAELLAERGGRERDRARALATEALATARELGMRPMAARAEALRTR